MPTNWIKTEKTRLEKERQEYLATHPSDYWTCPQGTSNIKFNIDELPQIEDTGFGKKARLHITVDGQDKIWSVTVNSPLWRELLDYFEQNITTLDIVRAGTGRQTRYSAINPKEVK